jgi:hypothetical protein
MAYGAIAALREAGSPVDQLTEAQRGALSTLSPAEVSVITDVQTRMAAVSEAVEGHMVVGGLVF